LRENKQVYVAAIGAKLSYSPTSFSAFARGCHDAVLAWQLALNRILAALENHAYRAES
jgi:hypothetical protein